MSNEKPLTLERIAEIKARPVDLTDIPEWTEADWKAGHFRNWKPAKKPISLRIDYDNLDWLKRKGSGYQQRLNDVIRWARQNGCPLA